MSTSFDNTLFSSPHSVNGPGGTTWGVGVGSMGAVSDQPYRFSFSANRLVNTIHAKLLSQLPDQGQSLEQLIFGEGLSGDEVGPDSGVADGMGGAGEVASEFGIGQGEKGKEEVDTWWLDVFNPTNEEMGVLSKVFNIDPSTTENIQKQDARERFEIFENYYVVCFQEFDQDPASPKYLEPLNMCLVVFKVGIVSFHARSTPHAQNVRRRGKQLEDTTVITSDWICYALIEDIVNAFGPLVQEIESEVNRIGGLVDADRSRIESCRGKVVGLLKLIENKVGIVQGLAKRFNESEGPESDIEPQLLGIQEHLVLMTQNLNDYEKVISDRLAQTSNEKPNADNRNAHKT